MKKIRCPKCDEAILFDETAYEPGRVLVFECPECHKQFRLRIPQPKSPTPSASGSEAVPAHFVVLENAFQLRQEIPLCEGSNVIGRSVKGTQANAAFKTVDPSIDTTHCIVNVSRRKGEMQFSLKDAPSGTGTFYQGNILGLKEQVLLHDGDVVNIGGATLIFHSGI
ncbi:MAG: FHA domain-containing protein [Alloprevotella sp.]|nr:FHA domain-containing protein [Alloprevotella sp.]MBR1652003.1 FHA domain-containing protein [Alloprevotella sp.]MBR1653326.1 FHA domain-containing protein [Alloprevotella sp.]